MSKPKIGVLTGGGDTTALNATLKGVALEAEAKGHEVVGIEWGWAGLLETGTAVHLPASAIDENRGGTIIRTSRTNLRDIDGGFEQATRRIERLHLDGLIAIGGDDTLTVAAELGEYHEGVPINFVTKTIDNDVGTNAPATEPFDYTAMHNYFCPGFVTAASWLRKATAALRTTAYSHGRILVLEAMGRTAGWLSLATAFGHPDFIVLPEVPLHLDRLIEKVADRYKQSRNILITIAEGAIGPDGKRLGESGATDAFGHKHLGGCSARLATELKAAMARDRKLVSSSNINNVIPGYLQRCGAPEPFDRDIAIECGRAAARAVIDGRRNGVACPMLTQAGTVEAAVLDVDEVLVRDETGTIIPRTVDPRLYDAENFTITHTGIRYFEPFLGRFGEPYRDAELAPYSG